MTVDTMRTDRLRLRWFEPADAANLYALDRDPGVLKYIPVDPPPTLDAYGEVIERHARYRGRSDGLGIWVVELPDDGTFVGWVCLRPAWDWRLHAHLELEETDAELGYRLRTAYWGRGYATELSRFLVRRAFTELAVPRVVAGTLTTNVASWRVMEKVGMRRVGEYPTPVGDVPHIKYALTAEEYRARVG